MKLFVALNLLEYIGTVHKLLQFVIISNNNSMIILPASPPCGVNCDGSPTEYRLLYWTKVHASYNETGGCGGGGGLMVWILRLDQSRVRLISSNLTGCYWGHQERIWQTGGNLIKISVINNSDLSDKIAQSETEESARHKLNLKAESELKGPGRPGIVCDIRWIFNCICFIATYNIYLCFIGSPLNPINSEYNLTKECRQHQYSPLFGQTHLPVVLIILVVSSTVLCWLWVGRPDFDIWSADWARLGQAGPGCMRREMGICIVTPRAATQAVMDTNMLLWSGAED